MAVNPTSELTEVLTARYRAAATWIGLIAAALGAVAILGWGIDSGLLRSIIPGEATTKFNTAIGMILLGVALRLFALRRYPALRVICSAAAFMIGALTLIEYATGADFGIDELVFADPAQLGVSDPGRMAIGTALCLVLLAVSMGFPRGWARRDWLLDSMALFAGLLAMISIGRFALGSFEPGDSLWLTQMAMPTAIGVLLISLGLTMSRPETGMAALLVSDSSGGALTRRLLPLVLVIPQIVAALVSLGAAANLFASDTEAFLLVSVLVAMLGSIVILFGRSAVKFDHELARTRAELEARNHDLERSNADLTRFAYVASHDLREPLVVVDGYVQLLRDDAAGQLDETGRRCLYYIERGVGRMTALIDGLLECARADGAGGPIESLDLDLLVNDVLEGLAAAINSAAARIEVGPLPTIVAERVTIEQLFQNLISNGVKFGGRDGTPPLVELSVEPSPGGHLFTVSDNGPGIPSERSEAVFEVFRRFHGDEIPGTGIGLSTCKRIVERCGGRIWVESSPSGGAALRFTIPERSAAPPASIRPADRGGQRQPAEYPLLPQA